MIRHYDREGRPMSTLEWASKFEDLEYKRIAWTQISPEVHVSTVWMGLDHNFSGEGPPVIFESMAFLEHGKPFPTEIDSERYSTEAEARVGHERMVLRHKAEGPPSDTRG